MSTFARHRLRLVTASVCAVSRTIVSLAQPGVTEKEVTGRPHLPGPERERGQ